MLDKCERRNKIAPLRHKCQTKRGMCVKGVQFYCPSSTYPAIILLVLFFQIFLDFTHCAHWQNLFSTKRVLVKKRKHFSLEVYISGGNASCFRGHPKGENLRIVCLYTLSDRKKRIHISQISEKLCIYYKIFFFYFGTIFTKLHISVIH